MSDPISRGFEAAGIPAEEAWVALTRAVRSALERRRGILTISDTALAGALSLPDGYTVVGLYPDPAAMCIRVIVRSDDLDVVPEGAEPPHLSPMLTTAFHDGQTYLRFQWEPETTQEPGW